jgi:N-acetylneuraminic acid mutarotase
MKALNAPGGKQDLHSVAEVMRFDPATNRWEAMPPLPTPRSSHDVVVVGDMLYVVGGWNMKGSEPSVWAETVDVLDLAAPSPAWMSVPQPFRRRALTAAASADRLYVLGGMDNSNNVQTTVDVFDVKTRSWSTGPALPGGGTNGFSAAACTLAGRLYVGVADGGVHRLASGGVSWEAVAATTPRIVHRLVPHDGRILAVGGAAKGTNLDLIEVVEPGRIGSSL